MDLVVKMRDGLYFTQAQNVSWIITDPECDNVSKKNLETECLF